MRIELSHDLLAKRIYDKASTEDKMLIKVRNFIKDRFVYFKENDVLLSKKELNYIDPYLNQLALEQYEIIFIDRSKRARQVRLFVIIIIAIVMIALCFFFIDKMEKVKAGNQEFLASQLLEYKRIEKEAKDLSNALIQTREGLDATKEELRLALLQLQQKNDTLLYDYAAYKVGEEDHKKELIQALNIAQSAKISELAAPIVHENRKYAFQLASQAWRLNPENQQAMKIIYQTVDATLEKPFSKQKIRTFIKRKEKEWGSLSAEKIKAILNPDNTVVLSNKKQKMVEQIEWATRKETTSTTSFVSLSQSEKIQAEISEIQKKLQKKIEQKGRDKME